MALTHYSRGDDLRDCFDLTDPRLRKGALPLGRPPARTGGSSLPGSPSIRDACPLRSAPALHVPRSSSISRTSVRISAEYEAHVDRFLSGLEVKLALTKDRS